MNYKDKIQWLKENDPITYSEMTKELVGGSYHSSGLTIVFVIVIIAFLITALIIFF